MGGDVSAGVSVRTVLAPHLNDLRWWLVIDVLVVVWWERRAPNPDGVCVRESCRVDCDQFWAEDRCKVLECVEVMLCQSVRLLYSHTGNLYNHPSCTVFVIRHTHAHNLLGQNRSRLTPRPKHELYPA